jgi:hypothetical protein
MQVAKPVQRVLSSGSLEYPLREQHMPHLSLVFVSLVEKESLCQAAFRLLRRQPIHTHERNDSGLAGMSVNHSGWNFSVWRSVRSLVANTETATQAERRLRRASTLNSPPILMIRIAVAIHD